MAEQEGKKGDQEGVILVSTNFPEANHPSWSPWNKITADIISSKYPINVFVPRPIAPWFLKRFSTIPREEKQDRYRIYYPRFPYLVPKKFTYGLTGVLFKRYVGNFIMKKIGPNGIPRPKVVHALHPYLDGMAAMAVAEESSAKLVVTVHSVQNLQRCTDKVKDILTKADHVITIADDLKETLIDFGVPKERITVISLGVDEDRFKPMTDRSSFLSDHKLPDTTLFLYVGHLNKNKNVGTLLDAFTRSVDFAKTRGIGVPVLLIVGDGAERKALTDQAERSGIKDHVFFAGALPHDTNEISDYYGAADVLLLASRLEGKPVVIYEAMSSGCAIIASNIYGIPEQVREGENGYLLAPDDVEGFAGKMNLLLAEPEKLDHMKRRSRELLFEYHYTKKDFAEQLLDVYSKIY